MKIFSASQIKDWDTYTIKNEPIASIDLMERAAKACSDWITNKCKQTNTFKIFCGKGNNGGDGLAIARLLIEKKFSVSVYIVEANSKGSLDFQINLERLKKFHLQFICYKPQKISLKLKMKLLLMLCLEQD